MWVIYYNYPLDGVEKGNLSFEYMDRPFMIELQSNESIWMIPGTVDPRED
jgi:hypothetical protein